MGVPRGFDYSLCDGPKIDFSRFWVKTPQTKASHAFVCAIKGLERFCMKGWGQKLMENGRKRLKLSWPPQKQQNIPQKIPQGGGTKNSGTKNSVNAFNVLCDDLLSKRSN